MRIMAEVNVGDLRVRVGQYPVRRGHHEVVSPDVLSQGVEGEVLVSNPRPVTERQEVCWRPGPEGRFWRGDWRGLWRTLHQISRGLLC